MLGFPLLLIPFAIYNMLVFITPVDWSFAPYPIALKSGLTWSPTLSEGFLIFSLLMLMFEFIKTNKHGKSFIEHFLSIVLAGAAGAELAMVKEVGTSLSVLSLFTAICVVDTLAGFSASLRRARRVQVAETPVTYVEPAPRAEPVAPRPAPASSPFVEPRVEAAPTVAPTRTEPPVVKVEPVQKIEP